MVVYNKVGDVMKKVELLVPVGNKDCLLAAIHNGADAVYLGGQKFGARAYADNFAKQELKDAIDLCHLYGVKIYVTVNTMLYNEEIVEVLDYLNFLYVNRVDAVIMQDIGLINLTRKYLPDLDIHVSTQVHNHNQPALEYFKQLGCPRVVLDRELSLNEIRQLKVDIEKEVFVYGALCICYSGNCLFSALNGGRSANRGMCVGSCRLPYKLVKEGKIINDGYLLSTKDLNTLPVIKQLLTSKIDALKIEGRMKSKEYVAGVTKTFRRLIDAFYNKENTELSYKEQRDLLKIYNREFTTGYLFEEKNIINSKFSNHQGIIIGKVIDVNKKKITIMLEDDLSQGDAIRFSKSKTGMYVNSLFNKEGLLVNSVLKGKICLVENKDHLKDNDLLGSVVLKTIDINLSNELSHYQEKKVKIKMAFKAHLGKDIILCVTDGVNNVIVKGLKPQKALNAPLGKDDVLRQLAKLGNTAFISQKIDIEMDDNLFINIKELNDLRRRATTQLVIARWGMAKPSKIINLKKRAEEVCHHSKISILVRNEEQLQVALKNNIDFIYITDENLYDKYKKLSNIYLRLERVNNCLKEYKNERLLCTEMGAICKYNKDNIIKSDYYLNIANDYSIEVLKELKVDTIGLSVECSVDQLQGICNKKDSEIIIYGTLECMIIKNNIFDIHNEKTYLLNHRNEQFPVIFDKGYTHIFNCTKVNLLDELDNLKGFGVYRLELFNEKRTEVQSIINKVKGML